MRDMCGQFQKSFEESFQMALSESTQTTTMEIFPDR